MKKTFTFAILLLAAITVTAQTKDYTVGNVSFKMIFVEGGAFTMGCTANEEEEISCWDGEKPVHKVTVSDFWLGETEVTQGLWREVMGLTISQQRDKFGPGMPLYGEGNSYPMYYVSWDEAVAFCEKLNKILSDQLPSGYKFVLPTEAEWEYAARGGKKQKDNLLAGRTRSEYRGVPRVKSGYPNDLGLYDMSGSLFEWCADWYGEDYYSLSPVENPKGPDTGTERVSRGGCWSAEFEWQWVFRRASATPDDRAVHGGFRVALVRR